MFKFFSKKLSRKMVLILIVVAMLPQIANVAVGILYAKGILQEDYFKDLAAVRKLKEKQLISFLADRVRCLNMLVKASAIQQYVAAPSSLQNDTLKRTDKFLDTFNKEFDFANMLIIDSKGDIIYSTKNKKSFIDSNILSSHNDSTPLASAFERTLKENKTIINDIAKGPYYIGDRGMYICVPISSVPDSKPLGIAVAQISSNNLNNLLQENSGLRDGNTYILDKNYTLKTNLDLSKNPDMSKTVNSKSADKALLENNNYNILAEYDNREVLMSLAKVIFPNTAKVNYDLNWTIVSEVDSIQVFQVLYMVINVLSYLMIILTILAFAIGLFFMRTITAPILNLAKLTERIASKHDLSIFIPKPRSKDEIALLISSVSDMLRILQEQAIDMANSATQLGTSINEISATATQLSGSATETTTSIVEITTTVEQIKQISQNSYTKSIEVVEKANNVTSIAVEGREATQKTIDGINTINEEMNYIAQSTIRLGEQTQNIGEIINTVNSLADQTNLLSVNASIEAAKAGEYGKGFAVVAKEVKTLAEQSKESTRQISSILSDIQKAASAAVLATERGNKAVKNGIELSELAGKAIFALSESVNDTSESSIQISAASQQQLTGMEQLVSTMENIREALQQNLGGTNQLEKAISSLSELGEKLQNTANEFISNEDESE